MQFHDRQSVIVAHLSGDQMPISWANRNGLFITVQRNGGWQVRIDDNRTSRFLVFQTKTIFQIQSERSGTHREGLNVGRSFIVGKPGRDRSFCHRLFTDTNFVGKNRPDKLCSRNRFIELQLHDDPTSFGGVNFTLGTIERPRRKSSVCRRFNVELQARYHRRIGNVDPVSFRFRITRDGIEVQRFCDMGKCCGEAMVLGIPVQSSRISHTRDIRPMQPDDGLIGADRS